MIGSIYILNNQVKNIKQIYESGTGHKRNKQRRKEKYVYVINKKKRKKKKRKEGKRKPGGGFPVGEMR